MTAAAALFALLVIGFVSQSGRVRQAHLTAPILFVAAGIVVGLAVTGRVDSSTTRLLAEVTLALLLFHDAAQLKPRELRADLRLTGRLLIVGLPLSIGAGYLLAHTLFPGLGVSLALLLAAALAPTDAGLGAATVLDPVVPVRVRRLLNVESGLNDGLATPVVLFAIATAAGTEAEAAGLEALRELAVGALVGVVVGYLTGRLLQRARASGRAETGLVPVAALSVPLACYFGSVALGGNGYVAAFVAGTAYAAGQSGVERAPDTLELTDQLSALLGYAVWMLFGVATAQHLGLMVQWQTLVFAVLSLTVLRMLPVALCLLGSGLRKESVLFLGWFGPRGLASVIFALLTLESLAPSPEVELVLSVVGATVILSVLLHGITASPLAQRYGAWAGRTRPAVETQGSGYGTFDGGG